MQDLGLRVQGGFMRMDSVGAYTAPTKRKLIDADS